MIANVSAADIAGDLAVISDDGNAEEPDIPDLYVEEDYNVTSDNIERYFPNGVLASNYSDCNLTFNGEFNDLGVLMISQRNVAINGRNSLLINTVFDVANNGIVLSNLTFLLNNSYYDNEGSAILVRGNNVTLDNVSINYTVPEDTESYGIYSAGTSRNPIHDLIIVNSEIFYEGQNFNADVYNYALRMDNTLNAFIANNTIDTRLVLRAVNFNGGRVESDSDYSLAISALNCDNLVFISNNVTSDAIGRSFGFPTLDCFFIWGCDNSYILNNSFLLTDFFTYKGVDNYLYCLDVYSLDNLTVAYNNISVITTGGRLSAGTAYPIQLTGPLSNVTIVYNNLYSRSNGPNIGIYSSNSGGNTEMIIMYNNINITGLAGEDSWALVSGIEGQDSKDIIMNNLIEVHSVGEVNENTNIYGISYSQTTPDDHSFDIINNTVLSDGYYSVYLDSAVNSTVVYNTLLSYQEDIEDGHNGYKKGDGVHEREMAYNNLVFNEFDYSAKTANDIDSGYVFNYTAVENDQGLSNIINGSSIGGRDIFDRPDVNPLIDYDNIIRHHTNGGAAANFTDDEDITPGENPINGGGGNSSSGVSGDVGGEGNSSSGVSGDVSGEGNSSSGVSGDVGGEGNSSSYLPLPLPLPLPITDDANSTDTADDDTNSSEGGDIPSSDDAELPDVPDGDNGYVEDYSYHPRTPSSSSEKSNPYSPSSGNYSKEGGLSLMDMLVAYVNSNTEGGQENVSSYGGKAQSVNETYSAPSTEGADSSLGSSKSVDAADSTEDVSSDSSTGKSSTGKSSADSADSPSSKSYELDSVVKAIKDNTFLAIALIVLCIIFLVVGYKRQNSN